LKNSSSKIEILIPLLTVTVDAVSIFLAYLISYYIRFYSPFTSIVSVKSGIPPIEGYIWFSIVTIPVWLAVFQSFKMYKLKRNVFIGDEFTSIIKNVTISMLLSIGILFFFREFLYSRVVFVIIWFVSVFLMTIGRYLVLKLEKTFYNKRIGVKNIVVVGDSEMADKIYKRFSVSTYTGYNVIGYVAEKKIEYEKQKNYLGNYDDLPEIISKFNIEKLFIALKTSQHSDLFLLLKKCEGINVEFMMVPDFLELITSRLKVEEVDGIPIMKIKSLPINIWNGVLKRTFDFVLSLLLLIITFPLISVIVILIKLTSKGPVLYKQERIGLDGRKFMMYKFRSMFVDAESRGPSLAVPNDKRVTKIGRLLRKFSLDEIPQFINVIKGEMSIVGPRPEREFYVNQMKETVLNYLERHRVKCGMTGWAQVNGLRGPGTSIQDRIDYDIYYIENWSLAFDVKIILKTFKEIFFSKFAY